MAASSQVKFDYDNVATNYNDYASTPCGALESQLIMAALGDCTGKTVLDLGGGTGQHAREAVDLGASTIDVVDISIGMLAIGRDVEKTLGRTDRIRYLEGDALKPLDDLPLRAESYDVVMANWLFSHAGEVDTLEAMFRNIVHHLKPGGRFVGVRDNDPESPALPGGQYGSTYRWIKRMPGEWRYMCVLLCTPPIEFEASTLDVVNSGSTEMYEKSGLTDVKIVPQETAELIRKDPDFWKLYLERPILAVTTAVKK